VTWGPHVSAVIAAVLALVALGSTLFYVFGGARNPAPAPFEAAAGDPEAGRLALVRLGCTACHTVEGVRAPTGRVGPSLDELQDRRMIAGRLANTPENAVRFILDPQGVSPGSAMPNLRVVEAEARDIVAFLYGRGGR
jgi:cytochrome c